MTIDPFWQAFICFVSAAFGAGAGMCFYLVWLHKNGHLK